MMLVSHVLVFGFAWAMAIRIDFDPLVRLYGLIIVVFGAGIVYSILRDMPALRGALETVGSGFLLTIPVGLATYVAIRFNMPLADDTLARMDAVLRFDWHGFIRFVDERPILAHSLNIAYYSFSFQLIGVPLLLVMFGMTVRAYVMVLAYGLIGFVSSAIFIWYPALSAYNVYGVAPFELSHINAYFGYAFLEQFHAVRSNPQFVFSLDEVQGILTFPSVHAAVAALCAWSLWNVKLLRYPFAVLNILMAISAISHGSHYLVDVVAGLGVALLAILAVHSLCRYHLRGREVSAAPVAVPAA